eukprot:6168067-Amphidinium_carterae.1
MQAPAKLERKNKIHIIKVIKTHTHTVNFCGVYLFNLSYIGGGCNGCWLSVFTSGPPQQQG